MMTAPQLQIDLDKIYQNARRLVELLADRGISVTGITKAVLGSLRDCQGAMLRAGVTALGDSRHREHRDAARLLRCHGAGGADPLSDAQSGRAGSWRSPT